MIPGDASGLIPLRWLENDTVSEAIYELTGGRMDGAHLHLKVVALEEDKGLASVRLLTHREDEVLATGPMDYAEAVALLPSRNGFPPSSLGGAG